MRFQIQQVTNSNDTVPRRWNIGIFRSQRTSEMSKKDAYKFMSCEYFIFENNY